ncbi:hypothetical protein [Brachyspira sp.]|uniref:hypothetical protein n=1 Tax=Brachyspira sp. TaxID=1977261 RepID=UPI003D7C8FE6
MQPTRRQSAFALRPLTTVRLWRGIVVSKNSIVLCNDFGFRLKPSCCVGSGIYTVRINGVYSVKRISFLLFEQVETNIKIVSNKIDF